MQMHIRFTVGLLFVMLVAGAMGGNEAELKDRVQANVGDIYKLLPFRLDRDPSDFVIMEEYSTQIRAEIVANWFNPHGMLLAPNYHQQHQMIRLLIIQEGDGDESIGENKGKILTSRLFIHQTGFKLNATGGVKYRIRLQNIGNLSKIVEIAWKAIQHNPIQPSSTLRNTTTTLKQLNQVLTSIKSTSTPTPLLQSNILPSYINMTVVQSLLLLLAMIYQLYLFEKLFFRRSII